MAKFYIRGLLTLLLLAAMGMAVCVSNYMYPGYLDTEKFVQRYLFNANGTPAAYLQDTPDVSADKPRGRDATSAGMGLWLQYAVTKQDKALFTQGYDVLLRYFMTEEGLVHWRLDSAGKAKDAANQLADDLRIMDALFAAEQLWGNHEWGKTAEIIGRALVDNQMNNDILVDFYDYKYQSCPEKVSLSFLSSAGLRQLAEKGMLDKPVYEKNVAVVKAIPNDGVFFAAEYNVEDGEYAYEETVDMLSQVLILRNRAALGMADNQFVKFIKNEFYTHHAVYSVYQRAEKKAAGAAESPAVYALLSMYFIDGGDIYLARDLYKKMLELQSTSPAYNGGYASQGDFSIINNIYPQLAGLKFYQTSPLLFALTFR